MMMNKNISACGGMRQQQLPPEMEEEILCRLPVKTLARFCCVSKRWRSLINQHHFERKHLGFAARPDNLSQKRMILHNPHWAQNNFSKDYKVVASCDGLLCVAVDYERLYLWNPSLGKWRSVPDPIKPQQSNYHDCNINFTFSLGYDSATDDYKLVKFSRDVRINGFKGCETWVFSLKSWSWRKLGDFAPLKHCWRCVFVNGSIYWVIHNIPLCRSWGQIQIFSYNLLENKYIVVPLPERYPEFSPFKVIDHVRILVLKGMLCVVALLKHSLVLWANNAAAGGWTKILHIPSQQVFGGMRLSELMGYNVFFLYEDDEVLMGVSFLHKTELLVCKETRVLSRQVIFNRFSVVEYGFVHVETLLSPQQT